MSFVRKEIKPLLYTKNWSTYIKTKIVENLTEN